MRTLSALGLASSMMIAAPAMAADDNRADAAGETASQPQERPGAGDAAATDKRKRAAEILQQMLPPAIATGMADTAPRDAFGSEMSRLAFENAYVQLWTRPGLGLKERSLITIAMLIALGNEKELAVHIASGLRNGLTPQELEEVIYHSSAYVGFPRASDALSIATKVIAQEAKTE